ncbi:DUF421 domain-containing protein [Thalassobacillus sp. CUG 92003]|uniref:DUF421 domain-containing protein n=1 Tax=Thalassobacillus sp. CUG 92003 TaxID=2736641 RepID=UPI0015E6565C|nr:DUF421 domain-containing protein [Thalassobacillus sp. CUG 92003]
MDLIDILIRTTVSLAVLYILCRSLSKKLISHMTFIDFVAGITIGSITADVVISTDTPFITGLTLLVVFAMLILLLDVLSLKSFQIRKILKSKPSVLIRNGKVLEDEMTKVRFSIDELLHQLRKKNAFYLDEVEAAILETDGSLSVLKKPAKQQVTMGSLNIYPSSRGIPHVFIMDGQILSSGLAALGKDIDWVNAILKSHNVTAIKNVMVAQIDQTGRVYLDTKQDDLSSTLQN